MDSRVEYWIELSDYDLETAEAMLESKRYLYVGFMLLSKPVTLPRWIAY